MSSDLRTAIIENITIADFLRSEGYEVIPRGRKLTVKGHDSLVITPDKNVFTWNSRGFGGSVIDLYMGLHSCDARTAMIQLRKQLPADKKQAFLVGTDDYMTKPVDEEEMLLRIKALLRRARIVSERRIVIGDVVLDYDAMTVSRGKEIQQLPQKEFLLLYKLLSYPGKIFTRIQLMDEIWGMDSETGWETVTVHIGRLRKRFEGWPEFEILSVRGLGYKAVKTI